MSSPMHPRFTPTGSQTSGQAPVLKVKTHLKAGGLPFSHNETLVKVSRPIKSSKVKTPIKAGSIIIHD